MYLDLYLVPSHDLKITHYIYNSVIAMWYVPKNIEQSNKTEILKTRCLILIKLDVSIALDAKKHKLKRCNHTRLTCWREKVFLQDWIDSSSSLLVKFHFLSVSIAESLNQTSNCALAISLSLAVALDQYSSQHFGCVHTSSVTQHL